MRQLYPVNQSENKELFAVESRPVTREEYDQLLAVVSEFQNKVNAYSDDLSEFKRELQTAFTTGTLSSSTAEILTGRINNIISESIATSDLEAVSAIINELRGAVARISSINSDDIVTGTLTVTGQSNLNNVSADDITTSSITTDSANIGELNVDAFAINKEVVGESNINEANITELSVSQETVEESSIKKADIKELAVNSASIDKGQFGDVEIDHILHNTESQVVDSTVTDVDGNYWIQLPKINNGWQRIIGVTTTDNKPMLSVENFNSIHNFFTRWSVGEVNTEIYSLTELVNFNDTLYLKCKAKESLRLYYIGDDYSNAEVPKIYSYDPIASEEDKKTKKIEYNDGQYFWTHLESVDMEPNKVLTVGSTDDYDNAVTSDDNERRYDGTEAVRANYYKPDQNVNKGTDVEFGDVQASTEEIDTSLSVASAEAEINGTHSKLSRHFYIGPYLDNTAIASDFDDYALLIMEERDAVPIIPVKPVINP